MENNLENNSKTNGKKKTGNRTKKWTAKKAIGVVFISLIMALILLFMHISLTLPDVSGYKYTPMLKSQLRTEDNQLVGEVYNENRTIVKIDKMDENLKNAVVAIEDRRFRNHGGFDLWGIIRATFTNVASGGIQEGASTITQQVVRRLFLTDEQTLTRKIKEAMLAVKFEQEFSKDEILEIYLNDVFMGEGTYGAQEAAKRFFNKNATKLTLAESAMIAGLPQAPTVYNPTTKKGFKAAKTRQEEVLDAMADCGYITQEEADKAKAQKISIRKDANRKNFNGRMRKGCGAYSQRVISEAESILTERYVDRTGVSEDKANQLAEQLINEGGLKITCTLNMKLQEAGIKNVNKAKNNYGNIDLAFTSIEANTGKVRGYYGGKTQIDMANTARQPGSTIKPLYIAKYLERDHASPYSGVRDSKIDLYGYKPSNYGGKYYGTVTIKAAVTSSMNSACLRIYDALGIETAVDGVKSYGFSTIDDKRDYNYAFALGGLTYGFKPVELASAYSIFANDGVRQDFYFVEKIETKDGEVLYEQKESGSTKVLSESAVNKTIDCLQSVVSSGTGGPARNHYRTIGKTGTTDNNKDLWFSGITGNVATTVWMGAAKNTRFSYGSSGWAATFYGNYLNSAYNNGALAKKYGFKKKALPSVDYSAFPSSVESVVSPNSKEIEDPDKKKEETTKKSNNTKKNNNNNNKKNSSPGVNKGGNKKKKQGVSSTSYYSPINQKYLSLGN